MGKALGFIEISGVAAAVDALDLMCKAANVEFVTWERKLGGRLVTVIVRGEVAAVQQAVEAAAGHAVMRPAGKAVVARPHTEVRRLVALSASRMKRAGQQQEEPAAGEP